jgi:hypothetical protein
MLNLDQVGKPSEASNNTASISKSATHSPVTSPRSESPKSPKKLRDFSEGEALNSTRRKLQTRHSRAASQPSLVMPDTKDIPRPAHSQRPVTPGRLLLVQAYADALIQAMRTEASKTKISSDSGSKQGGVGLVTSNLTPRGLLGSSTINSLARFEVAIDIASLNPDLKKLIENQPDFHNKKTISHTALLKVMIHEKLSDSQAGKTLLAMKQAVMQIHKGNELTIEHFHAMSNGPELKAMAIADMALHAKATSNISFGKLAPSVAKSGLPSELIAIWKEADRGLCEWAAENPKLSADEIDKARSALGFDLIVTRSIYPFIFGASEESHLVVPSWFATAVRESHTAAWPEFFADFKKVVGIERVVLTKPTDALAAMHAASE